jgi:hypothetical protein
MHWGFKGTVFQKNRMGGYMLGMVNNLQQKILKISLKQKLLYAYTENTLNGEISTESVDISVNNNMKKKKIRFLVSTLYGID